MRFIEQISFNLESDDPRRQIERAVRAKIEAITDDVANLEKNCADLEQVRITMCMYSSCSRCSSLTYEPNFSSAEPKASMVYFAGSCGEKKCAARLEPIS